MIFFTCVRVLLEISFSKIFHLHPPPHPSPSVVEWSAPYFVSFHVLLCYLQASDRCHGMQIQSFMLKPVQRIPSYRLLLIGKRSYHRSEIILYQPSLFTVLSHQPRLRGQFFIMFICKLANKESSNEIEVVKTIGNRFNCSQLTRNWLACKDFGKKYLECLKLRKTIFQKLSR